MKEDLALHRKIAEQSVSTNNEYPAQAIKMSETMEVMASAITGYLQMCFDKFLTDVFGTKLFVLNYLILKSILNALAIYFTNVMKNEPCHDN